jgi:transcriptional regulator with XRE-family HTH domain
MKYKSNLRRILHSTNAKRAAAKKPDISINEIAAKTGISRQTINRWLKDEPLLGSKIARQTVDELCDFFNVSPDELLTKIEPEQLGAGA